MKHQHRAVVALVSVAACALGVPAAVGARRRRAAARGDASAAPRRARARIGRRAAARHRRPARSPSATCRRTSSTSTSPPRKTGVDKAAAELGGTVTQVGPNEAKADLQIPFITDLTTQGVNAIIISADGKDEVAPALKEAMAAGIKVVGFDSSPAVGAYNVFVNQVDFSGVGVSLADWACELAPNCTGDIAILSAAATATNQNTWIDLMKTTLATDRSTRASSSSTPSTAMTTRPRAPSRRRRCSPSTRTSRSSSPRRRSASSRPPRSCRRPRSRTRSRSPASASRTT